MKPVESVWSLKEHPNLLDTLRKRLFEEEKFSVKSSEPFPVQPSKKWKESRQKSNRGGACWHGRGCGQEQLRKELKMELASTIEEEMAAEKDVESWLRQHANPVQMAASKPKENGTLIVDRVTNPTFLRK